MVVYVGKDSYIEYSKRDRYHRSSDGQVINKVLQNNPTRYTYEVIEKGSLPQKLLNAWEMCFIRRYNPKFNFTIGGEGILGHKHSIETRKQMSESHKGKKHSKSTREKMRERNPKYWLGKKLSDEHRQKISDNHAHYWKGKHHTDETKLKSAITNSQLKNTSGYFRVSKHMSDRYSQGFVYRYKYRVDGKQKTIASVDIKRLEERVKSEGLTWIKFGE